MQDRSPTHRCADPRALPTALLLVLSAALLVACQEPPRTTRLTVDDFQEMAGAMAESLMRSDALAQRGPESEPWIVSMERVRNLSSDVMTQSEQWMIMARLRASTPLAQLWDHKNVRFVLPPERAQQLRDSDALAFEEITPTRTSPTHTLTATIRSVTRATAQARTDLYYCEFEMLDLTTGEPVWNDRFEVRREALGHVWN